MRSPRRDVFSDIYEHHAERYDRLVRREDHAGNLLRALRGIVDLAGLRVVELGAGTGRVTRLLAPHVHAIRAFDRSAHMLGFAARGLRAQGRANVALGLADNRALPVRSGCADLAVEGWSFSHSVGWFPGAWREEIGRALGEMRRVLRPGGCAVVIESLGTGVDEPTPPDEATAAYYRWLEDEHGFARVTIRTDYAFASAEEACALAGFFFGPRLAERVGRSGSTRLPEFTGLWWRRWPGGPGAAR